MCILLALRFGERTRPSWVHHDVWAQSALECAVSKKATCISRKAAHVIRDCDLPVTCLYSVVFIDVLISMIMITFQKFG